MTTVAFPNQFGGQPHETPISYRGITSPVPKVAQTGALQMASAFSLTPTNVKWIIGGLFAVILTLVGAIYVAVIGNIGEINKNLHELTLKVETIHVDLVKSISAVEKQAVAANSRLDVILQELQRQRR